MPKKPIDFNGWSFLFHMNHWFSVQVDRNLGQSRDHLACNRWEPPVRPPLFQETATGYRCTSQEESRFWGEFGFRTGTWRPLRVEVQRGELPLIGRAYSGFLDGTTGPGWIPIRPDLLNGNLWRHFYSNSVQKSYSRGRESKGATHSLNFYQQNLQNEYLL